MYGAQDRMVVLYFFLFAVLWSAMLTVAAVRSCRTTRRQLRSKSLRTLADVAKNAQDVKEKDMLVDEGEGEEDTTKAPKSGPSGKTKGKTKRRKPKAAYVEEESEVVSRQLCVHC
jgi:hypothetical protein